MLDLIPVGGGVVGVVAGIASQFVKGRQEQAAAATKIKIMEAERQHFNDAAAAKSQVSEVQGYYETRRQQEITAQREAENTYKWVNAVRSLFRPFLTTLCLMCAVFVTNDEKVLFLSTMATTAVSWWFTERAVSTKTNKI